MKRNEGTRRFIKFLLVGVLNAGFGYGVYYLSLVLGAHYSVAALISTVCGVLFNFKTTGTFVFKNTKNSLVFKFIMIYVVIYLVNIAGIKAFLMIGVNSKISFALLILPMALVSFALQGKYVFNIPKGKK
ncbi:MAG: GtrA family protein [Candidatus Firestonebacteria bacterium]